MNMGGGAAMPELGEVVAADSGVRRRGHAYADLLQQRQRRRHRQRDLGHGPRGGRLQRRGDLPQRWERWTYPRANSDGQRSAVLFGIGLEFWPEAVLSGVSVGPFRDPTKEHIMHPTIDRQVTAL